MRTLRVLILSVIVLSSVLAIAAPAQNPPNNKKKGSQRSTTANPPQQEQSAAANASAATAQATNPYYNSTNAANPQLVSGTATNVDPATQITALNTQRAQLVRQQTTLQGQLSRLQNSSNSAAYTVQIQQLQTRLDDVTQRIAGIDNRLGTLGASTNSSKTATKGH